MDDSSSAECRIERATGSVAHEGRVSIRRPRENDLSVRLSAREDAESVLFDTMSVATQPLGELNVLSRLPSGLRRMARKSLVVKNTSPDKTIFPSGWTRTPVANEKALPRSSGSPLRFR
jgi:hypothetical protein